MAVSASAPSDVMGETRGIRCGAQGMDAKAKGHGARHQAATVALGALALVRVRHRGTVGPAGGGRLGLRGSHGCASGLAGADGLTGYAREQVRRALRGTARGELGLVGGRRPRWAGWATRQLGQEEGKALGLPVARPRGRGGRLGWRVRRREGRWAGGKEGKREFCPIGKDEDFPIYGSRKLRDIQKRF